MLISHAFNTGHLLLIVSDLSDIFSLLAHVQLLVCMCQLMDRHKLPSTFQLCPANNNNYNKIRCMYRCYCEIQHCFRKRKMKKSKLIFIGRKHTVVQETCTD